jgi:nucleoid DNA-binding protein
MFCGKEVPAPELCARIIETLKAGGKVDVPGFGGFVIHRRSARKGINPVIGKRFGFRERKKTL